MGFRWCCIGDPAGADETAGTGLRVDLGLLTPHCPAGHGAVEGPERPFISSRPRRSEGEEPTLCRRSWI